MRNFARSRLALILVICFTLVTVELDAHFSNSVGNRINQGKLINVLLLGIDARPGEINARSDTIILASINKELRSIALISIPRDTRVQFQGKNGKINMINQNEGPEVCCSEVGKLLATEVDYYLLCNFSGFETIIDTIGGVYLDVDIDIYSPSSGVRLNRGYQKLSGKEALMYVRYRGYPDADIGRIQHQQKLMQAITMQLMKKENISRLPRLIPRLRENVYTNLSISDMFLLASLSSTISEDNIITQTLPGYHYIDPYSGVSYWEADRQIAGSIIESLFEGHRFEVQLDTPPWAGW